ncbi:MAG: hypothetical protein LUG18_10045 [Candidatus Azobacteroides sp.]|nr:hypothetical protein [Candidatus Azobacteroides sp.]
MKKAVLTFFFFLFILAILFVFFKISWKEELLIIRSFPKLETKGTTYASTAFYEDKYWLHRVNTLERLSIMESKYKGLETDINYDPERNLLYVSHAIQEIPALPLQTFFQYVTNKDAHYFWLDIKNLNKNNYTKIYDCLVSIITENGIHPSRIIIESTQPELLEAFTDFGFNTSFYLPYFNLYKLTEEEILNYAKEIDSLLLRSKVNYLSSGYTTYPFIKEYFPEADILLWHTKKNIFTPYIRKKLSKDEKIKVILQEEISEGYR